MMKLLPGGGGLPIGALLTIRYLRDDDMRRGGAPALIPKSSLVIKF
jgi:hypothetical protein